MREKIVCLVAALVLAGCGAAADDGADGDGKDGDSPSAEAAAKGADGGASGAETAAASGEVCRVNGALRPLPEEVHEASGAAPSRRTAGVFWTHNDSGDPVVHAIDAQGQAAGRVRVAGAQVEDWEDVAVGPCAGGGDCLYIADIGDNQANRASVTVWRVPEPAPGDAETRPAEAIRLRYPDGAQDAEALFVLPDGSIHIVTKGETGPVALYRLAGPARAGEATLQRVRELAGGEIKRSDRITGAGASADGRWVALRTLDEIGIYPAQALVGSGSSGAAPRRVDVKGLNEAQGEGIGFTPDGGLILTSEGGKKKDPATFARLDCTL